MVDFTLLVRSNTYTGYLSVIPLRICNTPAFLNVIPRLTLTLYGDFEGLRAVSKTLKYGCMLQLML